MKKIVYPIFVILASILASCSAKTQSQNEGTTKDTLLLKMCEDKPDISNSEESDSAVTTVNQNSSVVRKNDTHPRHYSHASHLSHYSSK